MAAAGALWAPRSGHAGIGLDRLALTTGADALLVVEEPEAARDVHCPRCGSLLVSVVREGAWAHVAPGSLLDTPSLAPTHHIGASSKAPWHEIVDDLRHLAEF